MTLGATTNEILESRKIIEFQSWTFTEISKNSWTVNELRTCLIINEKGSSDIYKISKKSRNWSAIKVLGSYTKSAKFVYDYSPYIQVNSLKYPVISNFTVF